MIIRRPCRTVDIEERRQQPDRLPARTAQRLQNRAHSLRSTAARCQYAVQSPVFWLFTYYDYCCHYCHCPCSSINNYTGLEVAPRYSDTGPCLGSYSTHSCWYSCWYSPLLTTQPGAPACPTLLYPYPLSPSQTQIPDHTSHTQAGHASSTLAQPSTVVADSRDRAHNLVSATVPA